MDYLLIPEITDLHAESCGVAILSPGWRHSKRNLDTTVLLLGHQGKVAIQEESRTLLVEPSRYCFLAEGRTHWGRQKIRTTARYYWFHFKSASPPRSVPPREARLILGDKEIARTRLKNSLLFPQQGLLQNSHLIRDAFQSLLYEQENMSFTEQKYHTFARLLLIELNELILASYQQRDTGDEDREDSLVNDMIRLIYEHLTETNFSVKGLADMMSYNPDYLNRHFKSIMKKSLIQYIVDKRVDHSLIELTESANTLEQISNNSGFASYRNYVRQFKIRKNMVPSEYRKRHRLMHINNR